MRALRIEIEAPVCSFRYPHFLVGRQLTFAMPPPSTIFGHIASAVGEWPDPTNLQFAYWFTALGKGEDLENQQIVVPAGGRFTVGDETHPTVLNATVQPTRREFLLGVRLVLYLNKLDLADAFLHPRFPVVLGRSQDLACYSRVEEITLQPSDRGYFESTILPSYFRRRMARGTTVLMPRYIGPAPKREADFDRFIILRDRVDTQEMLHIKDDPLNLLIGPQSPEKHGTRRIVWFHSFTGSS